MDGRSLGPDGAYRILRRLDRAGSGPVWLVEQDGRRYAAKPCSREEAGLLATLSHPAIPAAVELLQTGEGPVLVMEYVPGRTLSRYPKPRRELCALSWAIHLAEVLAYLHQRGIVFRDLKPDNVIRRPDGRLALIDFGSARPLGDAAEAPATVGYAAPEQYPVREKAAAAVDGRADVYALGVMLHELLTGREPPQAGLRPRPIRDIDPALDGGLERIVARCTAADPAQRYQTMDTLLTELRSCSDRLRRAQGLRLCKLGMLSGLALSAAAALQQMYEWQEVR